MFRAEGPTLSQQRKVGSCSHFSNGQVQRVLLAPLSYFVLRDFQVLHKYTNSSITVCCKGPASTETLVQISWASLGWFNIMRSLFYLSHFKIDPLSVSFSSSMRLKDCLWSNSANDQRFRLFFDMEIIQSCTSHDPETSPKFK